MKTLSDDSPVVNSLTVESGNDYGQSTEFDRRGRIAQQTLKKAAAETAMVVCRGEGRSANEGSEQIPL